MPSQGGWTDKKEAKLRELWGGTDSTAEIGRKIGMSKNAIVGKAHRLHLPARPSPIIRDGKPRKPARARPVRMEPTVLPLASLAMPAPEPVARVEDDVERFRDFRAATVPGPLPLSEFKPLAPRAADGDGCRWINGDPGRGEKWSFCNAGLSPLCRHRSWCEGHRKLVWVRGRDRREDDTVPKLGGQLFAAVQHRAA